MSFYNGILNLTNWGGNVILPTLAGLFIAIAIIQFSKGAAYQHAMYGGFLCLMASGLLRAFETFASQRSLEQPGLGMGGGSQPGGLDLQCASAGLCGVASGRGRSATGGSEQPLPARLLDEALRGRWIVPAGVGTAPAWRVLRDPWHGRSHLTRKRRFMGGR